MLNQILYLDWLSRGVVEAILNLHSTEIYITKTVHDFIWGYVDPVLSDLMKLDKVPTDVFGIFAGVSSVTQFEPHNRDLETMKLPC